MSCLVNRQRSVRIATLSHTTGVNLTCHLPAVYLLSLCSSTLRLWRGEPMLTLLEDFRRLIWDLSSSAAGWKSEGKGLFRVVSNLKPLLIILNFDQRFYHYSVCGCLYYCFRLEGSGSGWERRFVLLENQSLSFYLTDDEITLQDPVDQFNLRPLSKSTTVNLISDIKYVPS